MGGHVALSADRLIRGAALFLTLAVGHVCPSSIFAQLETYWRSPAGMGSWDDPDNWHAGLPTEDSIAVIPATVIGPSEVTKTSGDSKVAAVVNHGTLSIQGGSIEAHNVFGYHSSSPGALNIGDGVHTAALKVRGFGNVFTSSGPTDLLGGDLLASDGAQIVLAATSYSGRSGGDACAGDW